jgi:hypothetical protein
MNHAPLIAITLAGTLSLCGLPLLAISHDDYKKESRETFSRTLTAAKTVDVDNVNGFVEVDGDGGNSIRVEGEKIVRALNDAELDRGKREVTLDINEKDGVQQIYVNGPFRQHSQPFDFHGFHEHNDRDYEVTYNLTVHVPRQTDLTLRTVNGALRADNTSGHFDLHDVNGTISMTHIAGSGSARTVNGPATVAFRENPKEASHFESVNGRLSVTFMPGLAANIHSQTLNGGVFTDFESVPVGSAAQAEEHNGRIRIRPNRSSDVRIGGGGPEMDFRTVNGSIEIHKQTN